MARLLHHKLDPASRLVRLMLAEYGAQATLEDCSPWLRDPDFLAINPAATVPVLIDEPFGAVVGVLAIIDHIEHNFAPEGPTETLMPENRAERAEMWRLLEWVLLKLHGEVTGYLLEEKLIKREMRSGAPDPSVLRAAKANLNEHLAYFSWLMATRRWVAGETMTLADFALAAQFSTLDYLGDIDWIKAGEAKDWYARIKSRPAFRTLLADRVVGMPAPPAYADLDF